MSILYMVRHGQAGPDDDYDRLSPTGEVQARRLGEYWSRRGVTFDRVYTGPRRRQQRTAEAVGQVYAEAGMSWPAAELLEDLDEMRVDKVFAMHASSYVNDPRIGDPRGMQRLFSEVIERWVLGDLLADGVEPWCDFCARIGRALETLRAVDGPGRRVVAFTSGGTISAAMRHALGLDDASTIRLAWVVRNAAWSEFLFSRERFTLAAFNALPHLDEPSLITVR